MLKLIERLCANQQMVDYASNLVLDLIRNVTCGMELIQIYRYESS